MIVSVCFNQITMTLCEFIQHPYYMLTANSIIDKVYQKMYICFPEMISIFQINPNLTLLWSDNSFETYNCLDPILVLKAIVFVFKIDLLVFYGKSTQDRSKREEKESAREENQLWQLSIANEEKYTYNSYMIKKHTHATINNRHTLFAYKINNVYNKLHDREWVDKRKSNCLGRQGSSLDLGLITYYYGPATDQTQYGWLGQDPRVESSSRLESIWSFGVESILVRVTVRLRWWSQF